MPMNIHDPKPSKLWKEQHQHPAEIFFSCIASLSFYPKVLYVLAFLLLLEKKKERNTQRIIQ
jgi:hypothetical protein